MCLHACKIDPVAPVCTAIVQAIHIRRTCRGGVATVSWSLLQDLMTSVLDLGDWLKRLGVSVLWRLTESGSELTQLGCVRKCAMRQQSGLANPPAISVFATG
eukprot:scaffold289309_cov24-Tisochrysis_lutea.AAC.1